MSLCDGNSEAPEQPEAEGRELVDGEDWPNGCKKGKRVYFTGQALEEAWLVGLGWRRG